MYPLCGTPTGLYESASPNRANAATPRRSAPRHTAPGCHCKGGVVVVGGEETEARKGATKRKIEGERETRRGDRGESVEKGKQRGRERRSASGFFFGSNQERTKSRATVPRVRDRSNFFSPRFDTRILARTHTMPTLLRAGARVLVSIRNISNSVLPLPTRFVTLHALSTFIPCVVFIPSLATRSSFQPNLFIPRKRRVISIREFSSRPTITAKHRTRRNRETPETDCLFSFFFFFFSLFCCCSSPLPPFPLHSLPVPRCRTLINPIYIEPHRPSTTVTEPGAHTFRYFLMGHSLGGK